jgi:conjugal transfer pilus assembly protein TraF
MIKSLVVFALFILLQLVPAYAYAKQDFFNQSYRGWLWFEEKEKNPKDDLKPEQSGIAHIPTKQEMQQARRENEEFKEELENLRHMMIRYPDNINYIRLYKEKEQQMLDGAMVLARNFAMANFLNPNLADNLKAPQNIYGRNVAKSEKQDQDKQIIKSLTSKIELFVFRKANCAHCPLLEKHLNSFANKYGFNVEAVSADNSKSSYFKTHNNPAITKALNLQVMPTVIAVTRDSAMRFELARGAVSIPDLEDKALLLAEYLQTQQEKDPQAKKRRRDTPQEESQNTVKQ